MHEPQFRNLAVVGFPDIEAHEYIKAIFEGTFANPEEHFLNGAEIGKFGFAPLPKRTRRRSKEKESVTIEARSFLEFALENEWYRLNTVRAGEIASENIHDPGSFRRRLAESSGTLLVINLFSVWPAMAHKGFFGKIAHAQKTLGFNLGSSISLACEILWDRQVDDPIFAEARLSEVDDLINTPGVILHYNLDDPNSPVSIDGLKPADAARLYTALALVPVQILRESSRDFAAIRQVFSAQDQPMVVATRMKIRDSCRDIDDRDIQEAFDHVFGPQFCDRMVSQQQAVNLVEYDLRSQPRSPIINIRPSAKGGRFAWSRLKTWAKQRPRPVTPASSSMVIPTTQAATRTLVEGGRKVGSAVAAAARRTGRWKTTFLVLGMTTLLVVATTWFGFRAVAPWTLWSVLGLGAIFLFTRLWAIESRWSSMAAHLRAIGETAQGRPIGANPADPVLTILNARAGRSGTSSAVPTSTAASASTHSHSPSPNGSPK